MRLTVLLMVVLAACGPQSNAANGNDDGGGETTQVEPGNTYKWWTDGDTLVSRCTDCPPVDFPYPCQSARAYRDRLGIWWGFGGRTMDAFTGSPSAWSLRSRFTGGPLRDLDSFGVDDFGRIWIGAVSRTGSATEEDEKDEDAVHVAHRRRADASGRPRARARMDAPRPTRSCTARHSM